MSLCVVTTSTHLVLRSLSIAVLTFTGRLSFAITGLLELLVSVLFRSYPSFRNGLRLGNASGRGIDVVSEWPAGAIICSCRSVTRGALTSAWHGGCRDASALSRETEAGTVCGSCIPLLAAIANQRPELIVAVPGWRLLLGMSILVTCY